MSIVLTVNGYFPDPSVGRPVANADIYIGNPDTDPEVATNQKTVRIKQEDGTFVSVSQPINTGAGGVPLYNGSPVSIIVDGAYSLKILDSYGSQIYYNYNIGDSVSNITEFSSLTDAVSKIGSSETTLVIASATTLTANTTTPSTLKIVVEKGGSINHGAYTITINGPFECGDRQLVFTGTGTVLFGAGAVYTASAVWTGATGDGTTDDATAIQMMLNSGAKRVLLPEPSVNYSTATTLTIPAQVELIGVGSAIEDPSVTITPTAAVTTGILVQRTKGVSIKGIGIDMSNMADGSIGIDWDGVWRSTLDDLKVSNVTGATSIGIRLKYNDSPDDFGTYWNKLTNVRSEGSGGYGFYILGKSGGPRVTTLTMTNIRSNCATGYFENEAGSGIILINPNFESNTTYSIQQTNKSSSTYTTVIGGETDAEVDASSTLFINHVATGTATAGTTQALFIHSDLKTTGRLITDNKALTISLASDQINPSLYSSIAIQSSGGTIALTSNPQILDGQDGQVLILVGRSNTNNVTFTDGNGLRLAGAWTSNQYDTLTLQYIALLNEWVELCRSDN